MEQKTNIKDRLFQYATRDEIIEDTDLITAEEAEELWQKYLPDIKRRWNDSEAPQMVIWVGCTDNADYHTEGKSIDYGNCELENGRFYRITRKLIS